MHAPTEQRFVLLVVTGGGLQMLVRHVVIVHCPQDSAKIPCALVAAHLLAQRQERPQYAYQFLLVASQCQAVASYGGRHQWNKAIEMRSVLGKLFVAAERLEQTNERGVHALAESASGVCSVRRA